MNIISPGILVSLFCLGVGLAAQERRFATFFLSIISPIRNPWKK